MKKRVVLLFLSGILTFGSMPHITFAEAEPNAQTAAENTEETSIPEETQDSENTEDPTSAEDPETPVSENTETPTPEAPAAPENTPIPEETPVPENTEAPTPTEAAPETVVIDTYEKLLDAIANVEAAASPVVIPVKGTIVVSGTIVIPEGKMIHLVPAEAGETRFVRDDSFVSDMFLVSSNATLLLTGNEQADLVLDGKQIQASGALVRVQEAANFGLGKKTILENNKTATDGGAIYNTDGSILLQGGIIRNNEALKGAVYTNTKIQLGSGTGEAVIIKMLENKTADEKKSDIYLAETVSGLYVKDLLKTDTDSSEFCIEVENPDRTDAILVAADGIVVKEDLLPYITLYNENYTLGEDGILTKDSDTQEPTVTPVPTETPAPTNTPAPTSTPIPSPTPTKNIRPNAIKISNVAWNGRGSIAISFKNYLDISGSAYYEIVPDGSEFTKMDTTGKGIPVAANGDVTFTIDDSEEGQVIPDGVFRVYIQVKYNDKQQTLSQIFPIKIDQTLRPAPTATPAPTTRPALVYQAKESVVDGLSEKIPAYAKKIHYFTVAGAGSDNTDPQEGDVKWEAAYWSAGNQKHYKDNMGRFYMIFAKDYEAEKDITIQIHYTKYIYRNGQWMENGTEALPYTITVYPATPEKDPELNNGYGGIADANTLAEAGISLESDSYIADNATTADETPILSWFFTLAVAALASVFGFRYKTHRK